MSKPVASSSNSETKFQLSYGERDLPRIAPVGYRRGFGVAEHDRLEGNERPRRAAAAAQEPVRGEFQAGCLYRLRLGLAMVRTDSGARGIGRVRYPWT